MRLLAMVVLLAPLSAHAADMNAPVVPKAPTLGSEISRGRDAADACRAADAVRYPQIYLQCIDAAHEGNRQSMGTSFEAFDAGLYFKARRQFEILSNLMPKDALVRSDFEMEDARYQNAKAVIGATDEQVRLAPYF